MSEGTTLSLMVTATDSDVPANALSFSLEPGAPAGASINATTGVLSWTPSEAQGPGTYLLTVRVTDDGTPNLNDTESFTVIVEEANSAPVLAAIADQTVSEGTTLSLTATATDSDVPANTLTFSLEAGAPAGASINATTGVLSWTPSDAQGPGTYLLTVRVTDDGTPNLNDTESFTVIVEEANSAPVLAALADQTVSEGATLTVSVSVTDADLPANSLAFSLEPGAPEGASIDGTSGVLTWTPSEAQGDTTSVISIRVTDNGSPNLSDSKSFTVLVEEANSAPVPMAIADQTVTEGTTLSLTVTATDSDVPANALSFSLEPGAPAGASINATTGVLSWTPSEAQGPGTYLLTVRVTDDGTPAMSDSKSFTVVVEEANSAPVLMAIADQTVTEGATLSLTATATDSDVPANALSFSLEPGAPAGASINATTGVMTWTPSEAQGPGSYVLTVRVTDDGTPNLNDTESFTVVVEEANSAPTLAAIADQTVTEGETLTLTATATDSDAPANMLTFSLEPGAPAGTSIDPSTGVLTWTPSEAQGPGTYVLTVRVTDDGTPSLSDAKSLTIVVHEANTAPVLAAIADQAVTERATLTLTVTATDSDAPANALTFSLEAGAPSGASVAPTSGALSWTPTEAQGPDTYVLTVHVTDDGTPSLSDTKSFTVFVEEANSAPVLAAIADQTVIEGTTLSLAATATDPDSPANALTFSLGPNTPPGASIHALTGLFTWTPQIGQEPRTNLITVVVTDDGLPLLSEVVSFRVFVVTQPVAALMITTAGDVTITWRSIPGRIYRVQYKPDLNAQHWIDLSSDLLANSEVTDWSEPVNAAQRFYRVVLTQ
jgi:predicted transcriptional regulator